MQRKPIPRQVRHLVLEHHNHQCKMCGALGPGADAERMRQAGQSEPASLHLHHTDPVAEGGSHHPTNLWPLCSRCHYHFHSNRATPDDLQTNLDDVEVSTTPADYRIIRAFETSGPGSAGDIAGETGISREHTRRRIYALGAVDLLAPRTWQEWDLADRVDTSVRGQVPDTPIRAAQLTRDRLIERMLEAGLPSTTVSPIVGIGERAIEVAVDRARAFDAPIPPRSTEDPDLDDVARCVESLDGFFGDN